AERVDEGAGAAERRLEVAAPAGAAVEDRADLRKRLDVDEVELAVGEELEVGGLALRDLGDDAEQWNAEPGQVRDVGVGWELSASRCGKGDESDDDDARYGQVPETLSHVLLLLCGTDVSCIRSAHGANVRGS